MDSFCHFFADGMPYNGYPVADNITPETGCKKDSIMAWKDGIVTRAVYDIPQLKGVDWIGARSVATEDAMTLADGGVVCNCDEP